MNLSDLLIATPLSKGYNLGSVAAGTATFSAANGYVQVVTATGDIALAITNQVAPSAMVLLIKASGADRTITVPSAWKDTLTNISGSSFVIRSGQEANLLVTYDGTTWWFRSSGNTTIAKTASFTLDLTMASAFVECAAGAAFVVTIPTNASVPFPIGTTMEIISSDTYTFTLSNAGVTVTDVMGATTFKAVTLRKVGTDTWRAMGA